MTKHGKRDILIHFDEEENELILYSVAVEDTGEIRAKEFDGARLDIPYFLEMSADDAERDLGKTVFSLIDTFSYKKTEIRPYEAINAERHRRDIAAWELEASEGDAEAQYMLFIEYHSQALFNADVEALIKAEEMLEASAAQNYESAISKKENWPLMRGAVERKIERKQKT